MAEEEKGFKVIDRRRIFKEGAEEPETQPASPAEEAPSAPPAEEAPSAPPGGEAPIDFLSFILSLSSQVHIHFGDIPDPISKGTERNLDLARQTIDLIALLKEKTRGNLAGEEEKVLDAILYELRVRYVQEASK